MKNFSFSFSFLIPALTELKNIKKNSVNEANNNDHYNNNVNNNNNKEKEKEKEKITYIFIIILNNYFLNKKILLFLEILKMI
jgi:hypothetical protein